MKKVICLLMSVIMLFSSFVIVMADDEEVITIIACSDFQATTGNEEGQTTVSELLKTMTDNGINKAEGFFCLGDYDYEYVDTKEGIDALKDAVSHVANKNMVFVQGNHDSAIGTNGLSYSGPNDHKGGKYGVFVINEDDYMWNNSNEEIIKQTAQNLSEYLNEKLSENWNKPIFVLSHLALNYSMRTYNDGDGKHANYIFDVLNEAGGKGLNIIFLYGHNHSNGWDDYLGGGAVYLTKGDKILIAQNSNTQFKEETLNFTYMNAGYTGYYNKVNEGVDDTLTMTAFEISDNVVKIVRYDKEGLHNLKSKGVKNSYKNETAYSPDQKIYQSPQSVVLTRVTDKTPIEDLIEQPDEGTTYYKRITNVNQLEEGGWYLLVHNSDSGNYIMTNEVVSSDRIGFKAQKTDAFGENIVYGEYTDHLWAFRKAEDGWLIGDGEKFAKLTNTTSYKITATLEDEGSIFTIAGGGSSIIFSAEEYYLNYNSRGLINGYGEDPAQFSIYKYVAGFEEKEITYTADSGEKLLFKTKSDDLFGGWGSFDTEESLDHFTTGGYLVTGDTKTKLSNATSYWRYNTTGYLEALGNGGSSDKSSLLTFVPLNGNNVTGKEKMYYFSMRVYTSSPQELKITWNTTKSEQYWSNYSGTEYGGRYPDYGAPETTLDNLNAIDNNANVYTTGGWHTIDGYLIAKRDAKYFMLNLRYLHGSSSSPTRIDDIMLYEVEVENAAAQLFADGYVVYDTLPAIDGVWSDTEGYVINGVYQRPEIGSTDTITATYKDGSVESFNVEVVGTNAVTMNGGRHVVKGENLLKNNSFEYFEADNRKDYEGDTYPFIYTWESTVTGSSSAGINRSDNGCFEINREKFVTGTASMKVRYNDGYNNNSSFNQFVNLEEGTYYISYYAQRTASDKSNVEIRINGECVHSFGNEMITTSWNKYSAAIDAQDGDVLEITGYNTANTYFDSFLLIPVEKRKVSCKVTTKDEEGNILGEEIVDNLTIGAKYTYNYKAIEEFEGVIYTYKEGENTIPALEENNSITLMYEAVKDIENDVIYLETPHHKAPVLPKEVSLTINGKNVKLKASWDEAKKKDYEKEGDSFTLSGIAGEYIPVTAEILVTRNFNYLEGISSTASFSTIKKPASVGNNIEISFDILPLKAAIDGSIGFASDNVTVNAWNSCGIAMRLYTDGRFQYYDGSKGYTKSNVFYRSGTVYTVRIFADITQKTYSAYVSQKGSEYSLPVCENASFRSNAPAITNIGQMLARGGSGAAAGEFMVDNISWGKVKPVSFLRSFKGDDNMRHIELKANETGTSKLYYVSYTDGLLGEMYTEEISYVKGEEFTLILENTDKKLMMIDENLVPEFNVVELYEHGDKSFVSSFMGSFAFYDTKFDESLTNDDPGVVQVNIMEIYSDRITLTTKNYGEYIPDKENPTPSVFERYNGDNSQTDVPLKRVLVFSDYHYLLSDTSYDPLRVAFVKMCDDLQDEHFDGVMIGGDFTSQGKVPKEDWEYVVESVLTMLKEKISPNIYIIAGNHDYNAGEADDYNSADYYNLYMKENLGSLEENSNGYFEKSNYFEGEALIAFVYEQDGIYFMGLSTSPDMMRGNLQGSNYKYTEGAMDWVEAKLKEIGSDKTVIFMAHFPLGDSNNLIKSSKGAKEDSTVRLLDILKDYPNLVYLYGHDHGSDMAYINAETEERVTRYDTNGYKID